MDLRLASLPPADKNGEYKEERKCSGPQHAQHAEHVEQSPGVVITLPPVIIKPR